VLQAAFVPARLPADEALALRVRANCVVGGALDTVRLLRSAGLAAMMARIGAKGLAAGQYEADPTASTPALVDEVARARGLSREGATLYLQLLALAEPTQKNVLTWNGWKAPTYKKAAAELVAAKLVVEGKRERSGREVFLPGAWDKGRGKSPPMEAWKKPFYEASASGLPRVMPLEPLPALFAKAWARVAGGDAPRFEEV